MGQSDGLEHPDEIPADVGLIPAKAKSRGTGVSVMVLMPVLAPRGQLERAKPPDVHAGIAFFDMIEMREAVHQALHVQRVDQADSTHPEETHPSEAENQTDADREDNDGRFGPSPDFVHAAGEFRRPALLVGGLSLIEPAKMCPPEAALLGTGDVLGRVGNRMV